MRARLESTHKGPEPAFLFGDSGRILLGQGIWHRCPVKNPQQVYELLAEAEASGIENPYALVCQPFSPSKPTIVLIPEEYEWLSVPSLLQKYDQGITLPECDWRDQSDRAAAKKRFESSVEMALTEIARSPLRKVVLSQIRDLGMNARPKALDCICALLRANPRVAHPFWLQMGYQQDFFGLSPELLARKTGPKLESLPLAGTVSKELYPTPNAALGALISNTKEREEHAYVVDHVQKAWDKITEHLNAPAEPALFDAQKVWHLGSPLEARVNSANLSILDCLSLIHPTPAVLGEPPNLAAKLIGQVEHFDRDYYAGAIGYTNLDGDGCFALSIRAGLLGPSQLRLYAGAGIVGGSLAQSEWHETEAKMKALLGALKD